MIELVFVETPDMNLISQISGLYKAAGWWRDAERFPDRVGALISGSHCFAVAFDGEQVVGMGRAISDGTSDAYIQDVTVAEKNRHQGIATRIVQFLVTKLRNDGLDWIGLIAQQGTKDLYKSLGFTEMPQSTALLLKDPVDAI